MNLRLIIFIVLVLNPTYVYLQTITYLGNGSISFENKTFRQPRQIKKVFLKLQSEELINGYKKYAKLKRLEKIFALIGGFGFFYSIEDEFTPRPKINLTFLSLGIVSSASSRLFHRPANRLLEETIELYNQEIFLEPFISK